MLLLQLLLRDVIAAPTAAGAAAPPAAAADYRVTFGKWEGRALREVPRSYLVWLCRERVFEGRPALEQALRTMGLFPPDAQGRAPPAGDAGVAPRLATSAAAGAGREGHQFSRGGRGQGSGAGSNRGSIHSYFVEKSSLGDSAVNTPTGGAGFVAPAAQRQAARPVARGAGSGANSSPSSFEVASSGWLALSGKGGAGLPVSVRDAVRDISGSFFNATARAWMVPLVAHKQASAALRAGGLAPTPAQEATAKELSALVAGRLDAAAVAERAARIPASLSDALLPFQREGVQFALARHGRALIADEMGLGKTLQGLAAAAAFRDEWPLLILAPSSLRLAWAAEIARWLPGLPPGAVKVVLTGKDPVDVGDITIISYDLLSRCAPRLKAVGFRVVLADESHYLKSPSAQRTKAALPLLRAATRAILLTGTPALSRPAELFSQLLALRPRLFPSPRAFYARYCAAKRGPFGLDISGASNLGELNSVMGAAVMVRRLKREVLAQLPAKRRQQVFLELPPAARARLAGALAQVAELSARAAARGAAVPISPGGVPASPTGAGAEWGGEAEEAAAGAGRRRAARRVGGARADALMAELYAESGAAKAAPAAEYVAELLEGGCPKLLVFAHHIAVLDALEAAAARLRVGAVRIDGSVRPADRAARVAAFQGDPALRVAVLGLTAAGTGLTLTAASTVVFAELHWTPGLLVQAEDRVHRIGQRSAVNVHYLLARGSVDDLIWPSVVRKLRVVGAALDGSNAALDGWTGAAEGAAEGAEGAGGRDVTQLWDTVSDGASSRGGMQRSLRSMLAAPTSTPARDGAGAAGWGEPQALPAAEGEGGSAAGAGGQGTDDPGEAEQQGAGARRGRGRARGARGRGGALGGAKRELSGAHASAESSQRVTKLRGATTDSGASEGGSLLGKSLLPTSDSMGGSARGALRSALGTSGGAARHDAAEGEDDGAPEDLLCPISLELMRKPVIAMDGHSYEEEAIAAWLKDHATSPLTNQPLASKLLVPNHRLRAIIASYQAARSGATGGGAAVEAARKEEAPS